MTVHLLRPAVGITDVDHLRAVMEARREPGSPPHVAVRTRNTPKRGDELCDGGSLYWIIKGQICARQRVQKVERREDDDGRAFCRLSLDADVVLTVPQPRRAHQGWRYFDPADAPRDLPAGSEDAVPAEMAAELRELGLL